MMLHCNMVGGRVNTNLTPVYVWKTDCNAKPKAMWWMWWTTVTAFYVVQQWPYFFGIFCRGKNTSSTMNPGRWSYEPPRLGFLQVPSFIWATWENHTDIYTTQQRGWTLSWKVFTQRGHAEDCNRPNNVVFAPRYNANTEATSHGSFIQQSLTVDTTFSQGTSANGGGTTVSSVILLRWNFSTLEFQSCIGWKVVG